jgi:hypothetical protein
MKSLFFRRFAIGLLATAAAATGCTQPTMAVPADVSAQLELLPVTERSAAKGALAKETFKVAPFAVTDVDRDWNSTKSKSIGGFSSQNTAGGYNWVFEGENLSVKGQCLIEGSNKSIGLMKGLSMNKQAAQIGCACDFDGIPTEVVLKTDKKQKYAGVLKTRSGKELQITALYEREGTMNSPDPTGFRVDGETPLGAVEVIGNGRIWLAAGMEAAERADLACLFSGLMLYIPPRDL